MEVFKWLKKEWPVRTGPTYNLETRSHPFHRFRERPNMEKSRQNPLSRELPAQLKRFIMNAKTGICQRGCPHNGEPPQMRRLFIMGRELLRKAGFLHMLLPAHRLGGPAHVSPSPSEPQLPQRLSDHSLYHRGLWNRRILCRKSRPENNLIGAETIKNYRKPSKKVS